MKLIILNLKRLYVLVLRHLLKMSGLNILNRAEASGHLFFSTRVKFLKKNIIHVPYHLGLTIRGVSFSGNRSTSLDGFIRALEVKGDSIDKERFYNTLTSIYSREKGLTISEFDNGIRNTTLVRKAIETFAYPWEAKTINQKELSYQSDLMLNRTFYAENLSPDIYDISHVHSHYVQFSNLYKSIRDNGFIATHNPPKIFILINGNKWKWIMSGDGNHRAYCNHLLGSTGLTATVQGVIDRKGIVNLSRKHGHLYSKSELETLFDILWTGDHCVRGMV